MLSDLVTAKQLFFGLVATAGYCVAYYSGKQAAHTDTRQLVPDYSDGFRGSSSDAGHIRAYRAFWGRVLLVLGVVAIPLCVSWSIRQSPILAAVLTGAVVLITGGWFSLRLGAWVRERQYRYFMYMEENGWIDDAIGE